jgi:hypothetical protein
MTAEDFRRLALSCSGAVEQAHNGHPDFRREGKVFATLGYPDSRYAMVKLSVDQRDMLTAAEPMMFSAVPGGWGRGGATLLLLEAADEAAAGRARAHAWADWSTLETRKTPASRRRPQGGAATLAEGSD